MLWTELENRTLRGLSAATASFSDITTYLHEAQQKLNAFAEILTAVVSGQCGVASGSLPAVLSGSTTTGFTLPADFLGVSQRRPLQFEERPLRAFSDGASILPVDSEGAWETGDPRGYWVQNGVLYLFPGSTGAGRVRLEYSKDPDTGSASPEIPSIYHEYLVPYARWKLYEDIEASEQAAYYRTAWEGPPEYKGEGGVIEQVKRLRDSLEGGRDGNQLRKDLRVRRDPTWTIIRG